MGTNSRPEGPPAHGKAAFTIASKTYLSDVRVLARSWHEHNPEVLLYLPLVDRVEGAFDPASEPFTMVTIEELDN